MSETELAVHCRETFVELDQGRSRVWRLPPYIDSLLHVTVNYADPDFCLGGSGGATGGSGRSGGEARHG